MSPTGLGRASGGGVKAWQSTHIPATWTSSTAASTTESVPPSVAVKRSRIRSLGARTVIRSTENGAQPPVGETRCSSSDQLAPSSLDTSALYESLDAESS